MAQCAELCWQLRGMAGARQVPGAKIALQHNLGLHTAIVVSLYKLGFPEAVAKFNEENKNSVYPQPIIGEYYLKDQRAPVIIKSTVM